MATQKESFTDKGSFKNEETASFDKKCISWASCRKRSLCRRRCPSRRLKHVVRYAHLTPLPWIPCRSLSLWLRMLPINRLPISPRENNFVFGCNHGGWIPDDNNNGQTDELRHGNQIDVCSGIISLHISCFISMYSSKCKLWCTKKV